jgi:hypothetical protein
MNGQDFGGPTPGLRFTYYAAPELARTAPLLGPTAGSTLLRLRGAELRDGSSFMCRFGGVGGQLTPAAMVEGLPGNAPGDGAAEDEP